MAGPSGVPVHSSIQDHCIQGRAAMGCSTYSPARDVHHRFNVILPARSIVATSRAVFVIIVLVILGAAVDAALLKLRWHRAVGVTKAIANIDIGAVHTARVLSARIRPSPDIARAP